MYIDAAALIDSQFLAIIHPQVTKNHIGQIVGPGLVGYNLTATEEMRILTPGLELHPFYPAIKAHLYAIPNYKRKIGSIGVYIYLHKDIDTIICLYVYIMHFSRGETIDIHLKGRGAAAHQFHRRKTKFLVI